MLTDNTVCVALSQLARLKREPRYVYELLDEQNLANALSEGPARFSRAIAERLIADPALQNHSETKLPPYEMLRRITVIKANNNGAI